MLWIPLGLFGYVAAREEHTRLTAQFGFRRTAPQTTFAQVDGFVSLLLGACVDASLRETLETILTQPNEQRRLLLRELIAKLRDARAPKELIEAMLCLMDDGAAEKAYVAIHQCER